MALKAKFRTMFPALVTVASPLTLVKTGLHYAFGIDTDALIEILDQYYARTLSATNIGIANSPYHAGITDTILYVDSSGGPVVIDLPPAAERVGQSITIKDVTGNAATAGHNITIIPNGTETIEGLNPLVIDANYGGYRLNPIPNRYVIAP